MAYLNGNCFGVWAVAWGMGGLVLDSWGSCGVIRLSDNFLTNLQENENYGVVESNFVCLIEPSKRRMVKTREFPLSGDSIS